MATQNGVGKDKVPSIRTTSEATRLRVQHHLTTSSLGGLILCPIDLSKPNLRILDSGTADGYFLAELREQLGDPESAELIGTDIAAYPPSKDLVLASNIKLERQSILEDWPADWEGTFDLVHQRHCIANCGNFDEAVKATERLIKLVKPGGWIQLVDSAIFPGPLDDSVSPMQKVFRVMANNAKVFSMDTTLGPRVKELLLTAGGNGLRCVRSEQATGKFGKGAPTPELEELGMEEVKRLHGTALSVLQQMPNLSMDAESFEKLLPGCVEEAKTKGIEMMWYAAWAQRVE